MLHITHNRFWWKMFNKSLFCCFWIQKRTKTNQEAGKVETFWWKWTEIKQKINWGKDVKTDRGGNVPNHETWIRLKLEKKINKNGGYNKTKMNLSKTENINRVWGHQDPVNLYLFGNFLVDRLVILFYFICFVFSVLFLALIFDYMFSSLSLLHQSDCHAHPQLLIDLNLKYFRQLQYLFYCFLNALWTHIFIENVLEAFIWECF